MCGGNTGTESLELQDDIALMVGQTCLGQGLKGASRVVAMQSCLRANESLLVMTLLLIFTTLLIGFSFYIKMLYTTLDGGAPRVSFLRLLFPTSQHHSTVAKHAYHQQGHEKLPR